MKSLVVVLMLIAATEAAHALSSDRNEDIIINADAATIDERSGISTYTGDVLVEQGTLKISADRVEVHVENDVITMVIASVEESADHLVQYEQLPDDKPLVEAEARRIVYHVRDERVTLTGDARLSQTADRSFAAPQIEYEVRLGKVNASSADESRVKTIFTPKPK